MQKDSNNQQLKYLDSSRRYYNRKYNSIERFLLYFYQIDLITNLNPASILEIGVGNKTLSNYLKQHGFHVTTCDYIAELAPDYVGDIRHLPFENSSYDMIVSFDVLHQLPSEEVEIAIKELYRVSKRFVVISIPHSLVFFEIIIKFSFINKLLNRPFVRFLFSLPVSFLDNKFPGQIHYWELGRKTSSIAAIRTILRDKFKIIQELKPSLTNSYFFVLEKIDKSNLKG